VAKKLDRQLSTTLSGTWDEGNLTYNGRGCYALEDLPSQIPGYKIDPSVRIEINENPVETGIYLPDINFASARFIPANFGEPPEAWQGITRTDKTAFDTGKPLFHWKESQWAKTGWTLIRRVEGEFIDVPPEGFFPKGLPEELYNWPEKETLTN
jgi:hypothetical protein